MATFTFAGTGNSSNLFVWLKVSASASYVKISPVAIVDSSTSNFSVDLEDFLVDNVGSTVADIYNTHKGSEPSDYPVFRIANTAAGNSELKMANLVDGATYDVDGAISNAGVNNATVALTGATQTPSFSGSAPSGSASTKTKVRAADQLNIELDDGTSVYKTLDEAIAAGAVTPGNLETALIDAGALKVGWTPAELDSANVDEAIVNYGYIKQINASLDSLESNVASDIADSIDSLELAEDQAIASVDSLEVIDGSLETRISTEEDARAAAKTELDGSVDSLEGVDSSLETRLSNEEVARAAAKTELDASVDSLEGVDSSLETRISSEEVARSAAKTELDGSVDSLEGADSSLETRISNEEVACVKCGI